ncbi:hypothetical protein ACKFKF_26470 [Phormidesmis sp. 146-12]
MKEAKIWAKILQNWQLAGRSAEYRSEKTSSNFSEVACLTGAFSLNSP